MHESVHGLSHTLYNFIFSNPLPVIETDLQTVYSKADSEKSIDGLNVKLDLFIKKSTPGSRHGLVWVTSNAHKYMYLETMNALKT